MVKRMVAASALLLAIPAHADAVARPDWVAAGSHVDGGMVQVDRASLVRTGALIRGWWRVALAAPRADGTMFNQQRDAVDCARRLTTGLETATLRADGSIVAVTREDEGAALARLAPATPGTTGETAARAMCRLARAKRLLR